jgi:2-polyprenyl-3-methyl-5-hydroxy-6-metoxy-1,4-benzoquinol methylase
MSNNQQGEALRYFKSHAQAWQRMGESSSPKKVNIIRQRNGYVLKVIEKYLKTGMVLDVGCGSGDLVCEIAKRGIDAVGVDYAQEMIDLSKIKARDNQLTNAYFECCSIFDYNFSDRPYDIISANGFIEYISQDELQRFFNLVADALAPQGSFVVGSRNRLFNLCSMNNFTLEELAGSDHVPLLKEAVALASGTEMNRFAEMPCADLQKPDTRHEKTGVEVATRFQYTPLQLIHMLGERGFRPVEIYPIHVHGVSPAYKKKHPELHTAVSNLLQANAEKSPELLPFASSFMLHALKVS